MNLRKIIKISAIVALSLSNINAASNYIGYQGIAFDNGSALVEQNISLRFTVYQNNGSTVVYQETKTGIKTTDKGFFSHKIGSGVKSSSSPLWSNVAWNDDYKLKVEIDKNNGTSFVNLGTQDLISVAYAKKSQNATSATTLSGLTSSVAELNHVDGVSSNIQTQLDGKMKKGFTNNPPSDIQVALVKTNGELTYHLGVDSSELTHLNGVTSNIQSQLDDKLPSTGNASTATKLQTPRTINGVSFDGSADISVNPKVVFENLTDDTKYISFVGGGNNGIKELKTDGGLKYNPFTNTVTASIFSGKATTLKTETDSTNVTRYIPFISSSNTDAKFLRRDSALNYNPSTDVLTVPKLNIGGTTATHIYDEDDMTSNSASALATQQSIKAYVDSAVSGVDTSALLPKSGGTMTGRLLFDRQTYIGNDTEESTVDLFGWREDNQFRLYLNTFDIYLSTELGELVVNEGSKNNIDFRVESDTKNHMLFVDASANRFGIGKSSPEDNSPTLSYTLDVTGTLGVSSALSANGGIKLGSGDFISYSSDADDYFGWYDNSKFRVFVDGEKYLATEPTSKELVVNDNGDDSVANSAIDFRAESQSNPHMLFVDASANKVGIGDSTPNYTLDVEGTIDATSLRVGGTTTSGISSTISSSSSSKLPTEGAVKSYVDNAVSGVDTSALLPKSGGTLTGDLNMTAGKFIKYSGDGDDYFGWYGQDKFRIFVNDEKYLATERGELVVNDNGDDSVANSAIDFRAESQSNPHMLFVDASANKVGIGDSTPDYTLDVEGTTSTTSLRVGGTTTSGISTSITSSTSTSSKNLATAGAVKSYVDSKASSIPAGSIMAFAGSTAPTGWLLCDGRTVSSTTYRNLYNVISTTYGGSSSYFRLPNLNGRNIIGKSSSGTFSSLGNNGGAEKHALTIDEMPSHNHEFYSSTGNEGGDGANRPVSGNKTSERHYDVSLGMKSKGGNQPHNILDPYLVLNYIIKY